MNQTHSAARRPPTRPVPLPKNRGDIHELRALLDDNLRALQALYESHQRSLAQTMRAMDGLRAELRAELHAFADARAPWVNALAETRALLYIALRELIVGDNEAGLSIGMQRAV
jgi:hypothetical protein